MGERTGAEPAHSEWCLAEGVGRNLILYRNTEGRVMVGVFIAPITPLYFF